MSTTNDGVYTALTSTTSTYYDDKTATLGKSYFYKVTAFRDGVGQSVFSTSDEGYRRIPAPSNMIATKGTYTDYIKVSWDKDTVNAYSSYKIYRSNTYNGIYSLAGTVGGTVYFVSR